jgi:hypothetical protein
MGYGRMPLLKAHFEDNLGLPLSGGKIYTYIAGTNTPTSTFSDNVGTPNANPVILNSSGEANIYLDDEFAYKFLIKDSSDNLIDTQDNISTSGSGLSSLNYQVKVSSLDSIGEFLSSKFIWGDNMDVSILSPEEGGFRISVNTKDFVSGVGTTGTLPVFTDGLNGVIGDSKIKHSATGVIIDGDIGTSTFGDFTRKIFSKTLRLNDGDVKPIEPISQIAQYSTTYAGDTAYIESAGLGNGLRINRSNVSATGTDALQVQTAAGRAIYAYSDNASYSVFVEGGNIASIYGGNGIVSVGDLQAQDGFELGGNQVHDILISTDGFSSSDDALITAGYLNSNVTLQIAYNNGNEIDTSAGNLPLVLTDGGISITSLSNTEDSIFAKGVVLGEALSQISPADCTIQHIDNDFYGYTQNTWMSFTGAEIQAGVILTEQSITIVKDGGNWYAEVEATGGGDLICNIGSKYHLLNCTTNSGTDGKARSIDPITLGTATTKSNQFVFINLDVGGEPQLCTSVIPGASVPYANCGLLIFFDDAYTITYGANYYQRFNDSSGHGLSERGIISELAERARIDGIRIVSGLEATTEITINAGDIDDLEVSFLTGIAYQLHQQIVPGHPKPNEYIVANDPVTPYKIITNLNEIDTDAKGGSLRGNNTYYGLNFAISVSSEGSEARFYVYLPDGSYNSADAAEQDAFNYGGTRFTLDEQAYLASVCRSVVHYQNAGNGTITNVLAGNATQDKRNDTGAGGGGSAGGGAFSLNADIGTIETISNGDTLLIAGGININTAVTAPDTITINMDANPIVNNITIGGFADIAGNLDVGGYTSHGSGNLATKEKELTGTTANATSITIRDISSLVSDYEDAWIIDASIIVGGLKIDAGGFGESSSSFFRAYLKDDLTIVMDSIDATLQNKPYSILLKYRA